MVFQIVAVLLGVAFRTASKRAGKAALATVVPGMQFILGIFAICTVVRTGCEVVRTICEMIRTVCDATRTAHAVVNSLKPGATATSSQVRATIRLPAEPLGCVGIKGVQPHFHQPVTPLAVDNVGHVYHCSQCNSSIPTTPDTAGYTPAYQHN
ncbi:hypothetical protein EDC04DRAFT_2729224 [Pisolithus marmoratus]|nr:hypothetical protein EDC04DRAFT_2729224 [Pisolithus marmoratus]